jgi:DNA-binding XRE family transcriptional regulator
MSDPRTLLAADPFYLTVGQNVKTCRKQNDNMSQQALAEIVGLTRTSLTNIEKGRQRVQLHTLVKIARALKTDVDSLLPKQVKQDGDTISASTRLDESVRPFFEDSIHPPTIASKKYPA